jgi:hypothetical protein
MASAHTTAPRAAQTGTAGATTTRTEKGISLARGPALILGTILIAVGLYLLYKAHSFPKFSNLPNGHAPADGKFLFGLFAANGWTGMLTAVGGGLLLFGAAQHLLAKTMSLIVGVALGAAAVIALASGNVLGMAAANGWTELGWGACAVILLFNSLIPRRRRTVEVVDPAVADGAATAPRRTAVERDAGAAETGSDERTVATDREPVAAGHAVGTDRGAVASNREPVTEVRRGDTATGANGEPVRRADEPVASDRPVDPNA